MNITVSPQKVQKQPLRTELDHLVIDDQTRDRMAAQLRDLANPYDDPRRFAAQIRPALSALRIRDLQRIHDFATDPNSPAVMLIENLPTDPDLPPTPIDDSIVKSNRHFVGEAVAYGLGKLIGEPIGYTTEKDGDILHNLIPVKGAEATQSNRGSKTFLNFHNDCVYDKSGWYHTYNADFLVLYGHRPDPNLEAETMYIDAKTICALLSTEDLKELRKPQFEMASPSNFTLLLNKGQTVWSEPGPVISGPENTPEISIAANGTRGSTDRAQEALQALLSICDRPDHRISARIKSGQTLLVNNRKGIHARSSFTPTFGPDERWLLRANVRRDTWSMRHRKTDEWNVYA